LTLNNYGWSLVEQGRLREAKPFLELALDMREVLRVSGLDHHGGGLRISSALPLGTTLVHVPEIQAKTTIVAATAEHSQQPKGYSEVSAGSGSAAHSSGSLWKWRRTVVPYCSGSPEQTE
jgi:hypothetical protein